MITIVAFYNFVNLVVDVIAFIFNFSLLRVLFRERERFN